MCLFTQKNLAERQRRDFDSAVSSGASRCLDHLRRIKMHDPQEGNDALEKHRTRADAVKLSLGRARKSSRSILTKDSSAHAMSNQMKDEYKLHLVLDRESYARLGWLKASLEASSDGEIIRRALKAYEIIEPEDANRSDTKGPNLSHFYPEKDVEHIYIRLPARMKKTLDYERENFDRSYGEQVRQALRVLMQLARERERLLVQISKGGDVNAKRDSKSATAGERSLSFDTEAYQKLAMFC